MQKSVIPGLQGIGVEVEAGGIGVSTRVRAGKSVFVGVTIVGIGAVIVIIVSDSELGKLQETSNKINKINIFFITFMGLQD